MPPAKIRRQLALTTTPPTTAVAPGIGQKTRGAAYHGVAATERCFARAQDIKQPKRREALIANADIARLSKRLVELDDKAPVPVPLDDTRPERI